MKMLFQGKGDTFLSQISRYVLIGGFVFLIDFSIMKFFVWYFELPYYLASGIGCIFGLILSYFFYFMCVNWIFNNRTLSNQKLELMIFYVLSVCSIVMNMGLMKYLDEILKIDPNLVKIAAASIVFVFSFLTRKLLLFR